MSWFGGWLLGFVNARVFAYGALFSLGTAWGSWTHRSALAALITAVLFVVVAIAIDLYDAKKEHA